MQKKKKKNKAQRIGLGKGRTQHSLLARRGGGKKVITGELNWIKEPVRQKGQQVDVKNTGK